MSLPAHARACHALAAAAHAAAALAPSLAHAARAQALSLAAMRAEPGYPWAGWASGGPLRQPPGRYALREAFEARAAALRGDIPACLESLQGAASWHGEAARP